MKTYIINLERSVGRRKHILKQVSKQNLDFEIVKGIDGHLLSEQEIEEICSEEGYKLYPHFLTRGTIGCAISHRSVYEKIIQDNVDVALILEDDVVLPPNFPTLLQSIANEIKESEIISLFNVSFGSCQLSQIGETQLTEKYSLLYPVNIKDIFAAVGYVITRKACDSLVSVNKPVRFVGDHWKEFYENGGFESYRCVYPMPLKLAHFRSTRNYLKHKTLQGKIIDFVDNHQIPIMFQMLKYLRQKTFKNFLNIELLNEKSPFQDFTDLNDSTST